MQRLRLHVVVLTLLLLTACKPTAHGFNNDHGTLLSSPITPDGTDSYAVTGTATSMTITAPTTNTGSNLRIAIVDKDAAASADHSSCVTWTGPVADIYQPGIILRSTFTATRTRAITITDSIWAGSRWAVNVHDGDSSKPSMDTQMRQVGAMNFPHLVGALPWRFCARITGRTLTTKAWSNAAHVPEPGWNDPDHARTIVLPADIPASGRPGVYFAHLRPGQSTQLLHHTTRVPPNTPDHRSARSVPSS